MLRSRTGGYGLCSDQGPVVTVYAQIKDRWLRSMLRSRTGHTGSLPATVDEVGRWEGGKEGGAAPESIQADLPPDIIITITGPESIQADLPPDIIITITGHLSFSIFLFVHTKKLCQGAVTRR
ncbi:hypothetical protein ACOMHN_051071 [Nucella lapillus]